MYARIHAPYEVDRMLPLVRAIVGEALVSARALRRMTTLEPMDLAMNPLYGGDFPSEVYTRRDDLRRCLDELEALGAYLRDPESGLVEWYGDLDGEIVYLSWLPGEPRVAHWRSLYGRPPDRRTLPLAASPQGAER